MIWEIETDDLAAVFADVTARLNDGRTVFTDAFDRGTSNTATMYPITKRVTAEEIKGKSIDEVEAIAKGE
jgi:predicted DNA-binding ArsR family transcriptional regulator